MAGSSETVSSLRRYLAEAILELSRAVPSGSLLFFARHRPQITLSCDLFCLTKTPMAPQIASPDASNERDKQENRDPGSGIEADHLRGRRAKKKGGTEAAQV